MLLRFLLACLCCWIYSQQVLANETHSMKNTKSITVVDVASVSIENPLAAIKTVSDLKPKHEIDCDILIVGGGIGGMSAALKFWELANTNKSNITDYLHLKQMPRIVLTEETDWLGGQMTAQGVSALDENYLVETSGASRSYQALRTSIREFYRKQTKNSSDQLNPGNSWVTLLAFEPKVALAEINSRLKPAVDAGMLKILSRNKAYKVERQSEKDIGVKSIDFVNLDSNETTAVKAHYVLDATELGDLLPLAGYKYSTGSDSQRDTGEPHAPAQGDSDNVQDFTYPFILELRRGEFNKIAKPDKFEEFTSAGKFSFQGYKMFTTSGDFLPFWHYRRLIAAENFQNEHYPNDVAVINWDSNDLRGHNIIDQSDETVVNRLALGKLVSLGFLYWLQNDAPRDDGGNGYPELFLRPDLIGTKDGLSKFPYIRESRRVKAIRTIVEQDIVASFANGSRSTNFADSVGIGLYPVDIHGHQEVPGAGQLTRPFQIPLASLIPAEGGNLLPACKNIGTTHITNGAYRLHPIEWSIGEAQATLAFYCLATNKKPIQVLEEKGSLREIQQILVESGVPLFWFDDVVPSDEYFSAVQFLSATGLMVSDNASLSFHPNDRITEEEASKVMSRLNPPDGSIYLHEGMTRAHFALLVYGIAGSKKYIGSF